MQNDKKSWIFSKTIIFNALTILTVIATFFGYVPDQQIANQASVTLLSLSPLINLVLRAVTDKGVTLTLPTLSVRDELEK